MGSSDRLGILAGYVIGRCFLLSPLTLKLAFPFYRSFSALSSSSSCRRLDSFCPFVELDSTVFFVLDAPYSNVNASRQTRDTLVRMNTYVIFGLRAAQGVFTAIVLGTTAYGELHSSSSCRITMLQFSFQSITFTDTTSLQSLTGGRTTGETCRQVRSTS